MHAAYFVCWVFILRKFPTYGLDVLILVPDRAIYSASRTELLYPI